MKQNISIPCPLSRQLFIYGFFSVLCQLAFLYLSADIFLSENSRTMLEYIYVPYIEYPILSIAIIIGGGLLIDYIVLHDFL